MPFKTIEDVHQFLDAIPTFSSEGKAAADFSLERFANCCAAMGNPQFEFPSIHVAGSNGKGGTCRLLASMYRQAGYDVGLYGSPHILDYKERFLINGQQISDADLLLFFQQFEGLIKSFRLTYFEISTAITFWWFAKRQVDVAVIEVGLGGRLDATNIITPLASVITTVALDHTDILGDTIEEITAEKAGIIKKGVPVVTGNIPPEAIPVIRDRASQKRALVHPIHDFEPAYSNGVYRITVDNKQLRVPSTLQMPVQAFNIAAAWKVTKILEHLLPVTEQNRRTGVEKVEALFPNIARFEKISARFEWYFDGAHNTQAVDEMKKMVQTKQPVTETTLVFSLMRDKINEKMMSEFSEFKKIIYHTLPLGRAATMSDIHKWLPQAQSFPASPTARKSLLKEFESELVIFAGSFYFYATVRDWLSS